MTHLSRLFSCLRTQPTTGDDAASAGAAAASVEPASRTRRPQSRAQSQPRSRPRPQAHSQPNPIPRPPSLRESAASVGLLTHAFAARNPVAQAAAEAFDNCLDAWVQASPPEERHNRPRVRHLIQEAYWEQATSLDLSSSGMILQKLTSLPDCLAQLTSVTHLKVSFNELGALPALPPALTILDVRVNVLLELPHLPQTLTTLEGQDNGLTRLPDLPPALTHLMVHDNQLIELPALPPSLVYVGVVNNQLTALPKLPDTLSELAVAENRLQVLPELPSNLTRLVADRATIRATQADLEEQRAMLIAAGNPHLTPAVAHTDVSAPAEQDALAVAAREAADIGQLGAELAREVTANFAPGSAEAASLACTSRHWRAMLQPRVDMDRQFASLQRQLVQLTRLTDQDSASSDQGGA